MGSCCSKPKVNDEPTPSQPKSAASQNESPPTVTVSQNQTERFKLKCPEVDLAPGPTQDPEDLGNACCFFGRCLCFCCCVVIKGCEGCEGCGDCEECGDCGDLDCGDIDWGDIDCGDIDCDDMDFDVD